MAEIDKFFKTLDRALISPAPIIVCLYTGETLPDCCAPMPRAPLPAIGIPLLHGFHEEWREAIRRNSAIHDGAVMCGRVATDVPYVISGWSFRLFAGEVANAPPNRGSAFNSCLAMSTVPTVDRLYLATSTAITKFVQGSWTQLASDRGSHF